ncbi:MAG: hypothetical protein MZW92_69240 [Comamonadaceae bacterium]|nr:hypothetical protein [Comamonadaceae bacterium]
MALGLVLLTGVGGLTSFGQAAFVGIGAYTSGLPDDAALRRVALARRPRPRPGAHRRLLRAAAGLASTLRMSGHYLPLATIAWGISLYYLFGNMECLGGYDRHCAASRRSRSSAIELESDARHLLPDLDLFAARRRRRHREPARLARPGRAIRALKRRHR